MSEHAHFELLIEKELHDSLSAEQSDDLMRHLQECESCAAWRRGARATADALGKLVSQPGPAVSLDAVIARAAQLQQTARLALLLLLVDLFAVAWFVFVEPEQTLVCALFGLAAGALGFKAWWLHREANDLGQNGELEKVWQQDLNQRIREVRTGGPAASALFLGLAFGVLVVEGTGHAGGWALFGVALAVLAFAVHQLRTELPRLLKERESLCLRAG